jgi:hypothetical protein
MGIADKFYPTNRGFDEFVGLLTAETSYGDPAQPGVKVWPQDRAAAAAATKDGVFQRWPHARILDGPNRTPVTDGSEYLTDYLTRPQRRIHRTQREVGQALFPLCGLHGAP